MFEEKNLLIILYHINDIIHIYNMTTDYIIIMWNINPPIYNFFCNVIKIKYLNSTK